jgi:hypothetical protein
LRINGTLCYELKQRPKDIGKGKNADLYERERVSLGLSAEVSLPLRCKVAETKRSLGIAQQIMRRGRGRKRGTDGLER